MDKECPPGTIRNPATNRCVLINGKIGKKVLATYKPVATQRNATYKPVATQRNSTRHSASNKTYTNNSLKTSVNSFKSAKSSSSSFKNVVQGPSSICMRRGLRQIAGTCFFNSVINSLMLGENSSLHFKKLYADLTEEEKKMIDDIDLQTCPLNIKKYYILKYMVKFFNEVEPDISYNKRDHGKLLLERVHSLKSVKGNAFKIKNIDSLKKVLSSCFDESEYSIYNFMTQLANMKPKETDKYCIYNNELSELTVINKVPQAFGKHKLDNCCIILTFKSGANPHIICGFKCSGNYYIYDANMDSSLKLDWSSGNLKTLLNGYIIKNYQDELISASYSYLCYVK